MTERENGSTWDATEANANERDDGLPVERPTSMPAADQVDEDAEFQRQMSIARDVMRDHRAVLAALAK